MNGVTLCSNWHLDFSPILLGWRPSNQYQMPCFTYIFLTFLCHCIYIAPTTCCITSNKSGPSLPSWWPLHQCSAALGNEFVVLSFSHYFIFGTCHYSPFHLCWSFFYLSSLCLVSCCFTPSVLMLPCVVSLSPLPFHLHDSQLIILIYNVRHHITIKLFLTMTTCTNSCIWAISEWNIMANTLHPNDLHLCQSFWSNCILQGMQQHVTNFDELFCVCYVGRQHLKALSGFCSTITSSWQWSSVWHFHRSLMAFLWSGYSTV